MRTLRALQKVAAICCLAASLSDGATAADDSEIAKLGLADAVHQAIARNLNLAAQRRALLADEEEVALARSDLLPQIDVGARAQHLEDDRSDGGRGNSTKKSLTLRAELTQVLYDEDDWAGFGIQKHVYQGQRAQLDSFELGIVRDAAITFLELDRSGALLDVRGQNRALTASNMETSRARIAAGWSSQREVLRWESQLASNDTSIAEAATQVLVSRFALNRARNLPAETPIAPLPAQIEQYGFIYARERIVEAISRPEGDRRLRDLLVRVGLPRSPALVAIDAAIAAAERTLTSDQRAFWVPSVSVGATVNHLAADDKSSGQSSNLNETEWSVGALLTFPLLQGGAKFASLRQSRESLSSLRITRRATAETVEQSIRAAFAVASGTFAEHRFALRQQAAAARNYELVKESYVLGVASILALLDGQSQLLRADQAVTNARYDFLEAVIDAEEQMALYPFLEPKSEIVLLIDKIEAELRSAP
jgi:outer membrane protein